jgi:hypothetical protein
VKEDKKKTNKSFGDRRRCEGLSLDIATIAAKTAWLIHALSPGLHPIQLRICLSEMSINDSTYQAGENRLDSCAGLSVRLDIIGTYFD